MPFKSKSQARKCWAIEAKAKRSGKKSSWNCKEFMKGVNWSRLPESLKSKRSPKRSKRSNKRSNRKKRSIKRK
jgi:hypothetical protein